MSVFVNQLLHQTFGAFGIINIFKVHEAPGKQRKEQKCIRPAVYFVNQ